MSRIYDIAVIDGDGVGPEVVTAARMVLEAAASRYNLSIEWRFVRAGAGLFQETGEALSPSSFPELDRADAILFGAGGLPDVRQADGTEVAPQIDLREHYQLFASLRPARSLPGIAPVLARKDPIDILVVRETTEGMFAGRHDVVEISDLTMTDRMTVTRATSEKLFVVAFEQARRRHREHGTLGRVTLFDKANVLRSSALMRRVFDEIAERYPDVESERLYVDAGAMRLVQAPQDFDVIVTENLMGDIISEECAALVGGIAIAPSADVGDGHGVFQPAHGSAPDIAGHHLANPVGTILAGEMMLEWLAQRFEDTACGLAARCIRLAVEAVMDRRIMTRDLGGDATTEEVTAQVVALVSEVPVEVA